MSKFTPCSVDRTIVCDYPVRCCLKKTKLVPIRDTDFMTLPDMKAIRGNPVSGWNVVTWNKAMPDRALCFGFGDEQQATRSFETLKRMSSTLACCLRWQTSVKESHVWML